MKRYIQEILRAVGSELKLGAVLMLVLVPVGLLVAVPVVLLTLYLPDWAYWSLFGTGLLWMMFGGAVTGAVRRVKEQPHDPN